MQLTTRIDPVSRYVFVQYRIPAAAGDLVHVRCEVRAPGDGWRPAAVWKHISDTARRLLPDAEWDDGVLRGRLCERQTAGRLCTLVWNPFTLVTDGAEVTLRVTVGTGDGELASDCVDIRLENDDVVVLGDWSGVVQESLVSGAPEPGQAVWWLRRDQAVNRYFKRLRREQVEGAGGGMERGLGDESRLELGRDGTHEPEAAVLSISGTV